MSPLPVGKYGAVFLLPLHHFDRSVQERRNSSALAMELCLSYTNPSIHTPIKPKLYDRNTFTKMTLTWRLHEPSHINRSKSLWCEEVDKLRLMTFSFQVYGALVTYLIVLIQFNPSSAQEHEMCNCTFVWDQHRANMQHVCCTITGRDCNHKHHICMLCVPEDVPVCI